MKRFGRSRTSGWLVTVCVALVGCSTSGAPALLVDAAVQGGEAGLTALAPSADHAAVPAAAKLGEPARPPPRMRVSAQEGTALPLGTEIDQTLTVQLAAGEALTLSLDDYVRVQLSGPATAQLLPAGQAAMLLRDGLATVDVSPRGVRAVASAFWLATPAARLDVADSVRVAVRALPLGPSQIEVVSGYLTLSQAVGSLAMPAGATACATLEQAKLTRAKSATLERASAELGSARACAPKARVTSALLALALTNQLQLVDAAAQRQASQLAEHGRLVGDHAVHTSDGGLHEAGADQAGANQAGANERSAREVRLALARSGAELLGLRQRARALRAQFEASALGRPLSPAEPPLLQRASQLSVIH